MVCVVGKGFGNSTLACPHLCSMEVNQEAALPLVLRCRHRIKFDYGLARFQALPLVVQSIARITKLSPTHYVTCMACSKEEDCLWLWHGS